MPHKNLLSILIHLISIAILLYLIQVDSDPVFDKLIIASVILIELSLLKILQKQV